MDAWEIYQLAALDVMGMTPQGILILSEKIGIKDPMEILLKVSTIVNQIRRLKESDNG